MAWLSPCASLSLHFFVSSGSVLPFAGEVHERESGQGFVASGSVLTETSAAMLQIFLGPYDLTPWLFMANILPLLQESDPDLEVVLEKKGNMDETCIDQV